MKLATTVPLGRSKDIIQAALVRLLEKPKAHRPFVVIEDEPTGKLFVQFAGSDGEDLLFDVPRYGHQCYFLRGALDAAAELAIDQLRVMGLVDTTLINIFEEAGTEAPN